MKYFVIKLTFVIFCVLPSFAQNLVPSRDTLKKHVYYLASEELKGRDTGKEGQKLAADYIESEFIRYGLANLNSEGYFHYYDIMRNYKSNLVVKNSGNILFWPWHFFYVSGYNHIDTAETHIVFAGYGSENELKPIDIKGKAVAFISDSPKEAYKTISTIKRNAGNTTFFVLFPKKNKDVDRAWGDEYQHSYFDLPEKYNKIESQSIQEEWAKPNDSVNIYYCFPNVLRNVFLKDDKELEKLAQSNISQDYTLLPTLGQPKITCLVNYNNSYEKIRVENVGGLILGKDTSKTIVVSAHYDHIGEEMGKINYGADDNASGTSVLLECARLMALDAKNGIQPETNVLFMAFSGEELGLLGSEAYVMDTATDLTKIILNINMDMVGRWDERHEDRRDFVYILTAGNNRKALFKIGKKRINIPKGYEVSNKPGAKEKVVFRFGSDHYSFVKKDIPISVFFTGLHDDYHTPRDTPDKINYKNLTQITDIVYQYIYKVSELK